MHQKKQEIAQAPDPVFIRGMQRSGTSIMGRLLQRLNIHGFGEGHLWFEVAEPFTRLLDPNYRVNARADVYTLGSGREHIFKQYIALAIDQFHRDHLPAHLDRWMDKSPGADAVRAVPGLALLFPRAQFIFLYRNGIACVESGIRFWHDDPNIFKTMCRGWAETMSTWREVRSKVEGRYIEIAHEDMVLYPTRVAAQLTTFLGKPSMQVAAASVLISKRVLSSFPGKRPGDYTYSVQWTDEQKAFFIETCGAEMEAWGYPIDFEAAGPRLDPSQVNELQARIQELEAERALLIQQMNELRERNNRHFSDQLRGFLHRLRGFLP